MLVTDGGAFPGRVFVELAPLITLLEAYECPSELVDQLKCQALSLRTKVVEQGHREVSE